MNLPLYRAYVIQSFIENCVQNYKPGANITIDKQWWILGEANEAAALGPPFLELSRGPPSKNGVCSFRLFCGILKWVLGLNNCGSAN